MPCHPDRVRQNYHSIIVGEGYDISNKEQLIYIRITRQEIASAMSKREIERNIFRAIHNGIFEKYKE